MLCHYTLVYCRLRMSLVEEVVFKSFLIEFEYVKPSSSSHPWPRMIQVWQVHSRERFKNGKPSSSPHLRNGVHKHD